MMNAPRKMLPLGIQNLSEIRKGNCYYVDKTAFAVALATTGKYYFLSRPRRFGKSLFVDTLKELFEGNASLFDGLYAQQHWDWSQRHPVIRISFGGGVLRTSTDLNHVLQRALGLYEESWQLPQRSPDIRGRFADLILYASEKFNQRVVILVDEYDKPILDNIDSPEVAAQLRDGLKDFYSVIKEADPYLRFVFLTGVSKFSKVSLFSGLNNLQDITLAERYSAICGYTQQDVETVFAPELPGLDQTKMREWYNGYNWTGEAVYNPYDLLLLFSERQFKAHWYMTGTPSFLFKLLAQRERFLPELQDLLVDDLLLSSFDVDNIPLESLLFQTGYLTIAQKQVIAEAIYYRLKYPNREVYQSLTTGLLRDWTPTAHETTKAQVKLFALLQKQDLAGVGRLLSGFFESIPQQWYSNNPIAQYEGYYASVFYAFFASLGLDITVEESSNAGRLDMVLRSHGSVLIFEFKLVADSASAGGNSALAAIRERGYAARYQSAGVPVHCIGIEFSKARRRIVAWDME